MERVVITGMGAVTSLGLDLATTWEGLLAGRSGATAITRFDTTGFQTQIACELKGFDATNYVDRKEARRMDRFSHYAIAAARQAVQDSGLDLNTIDRDEAGVTMSSAMGGMETLQHQFKVFFDRGPNRLSPFLCTMMITDMAAGQIAIQLGLRGPNFATVSACATGAHSIGEAFETIRRGAATIMIAGGSEAPVVPIVVGTFNSMGAISVRNDDPEKASRPFDRDRDGFVLGEGAGSVVLEALSHAQGRDARIYAEVVGYGATADAYHVTAPAVGGSGARLAMLRALREAGLQASDIDYVNAHGTSTSLNDRAETDAIKAVFGEGVARLPVSSTKSMTGHMIGAAGAVELIFSALTIRDGMIPPTINLDNPDEGCDLDYVPHKARAHRVRVAMSNSLGFGGHNTSLIVREFVG